MNVERLARRAYARPDTELRDLRGVEYDLLADCTKALNAATSAEGWAYPALAAAVERNLRLWSIFAADVARPDNTLSQELRARLFYLYEFTVQHSRAILDGTGSVGVLVDINMAVMRGLRGGAT
jgi:flagellar protein FlaF